jgi:hypothetical protein
MHDVGVTRTCVALFIVASVACGPRTDPKGPDGMPGAVGVYAGLRWVPPDATYVIATRSTEDVVVLARHLLDALGIPGEFDTAEASREMSRELGIDLLSTEELAALGVDLQRGAAIWSRGLTPTIAVPLSDPQRFAAELERRRGPGMVVQTSRLHDADVYTYRPERDVAFHWGVAGDWFLAHVELADEKEADGGWFESAWSARGALATHADFGAALDEARRRVGPDAPLVGLVRLPQIVQVPLLAEALRGDGAGCASLLAPLGRGFLAARADGKDVRGAVVLEVGAAMDRIRSLALPLPAGWVKARAGAPIQLDLGVDLHAVSRAFEPCSGEDLIDELDLREVRGGRVLVHALDVERMTGRAAAVAELVNPRLIAEQLDRIPGISFMSKKRKTGDIAYTEVEIPSLPVFAYGTSGTTSFGAIGGMLPSVLEGGMVAGGDELVHAMIVPRSWPAATWDTVLREVVRRDEARADLIRRLHAWTSGELAVTAEGRALVLTAHGVR